jgi:hypothetical protein
MTNATATFARLATEAAKRADAVLCTADEIILNAADGGQVWIGVHEGELLGIDGISQWAWHHASIAEYLAERASTNNWTL